MDSRNCILCDSLLTDCNVTKEHVIPNAIGGRKRVTGFICRDCNSETGSGWDGELARRLEPLSLHLGIRRQRGNVPSQVFPTASGGSVQVKADGKMTIGKPEIEKTTDGNSTRIRIHARDMKELRSIMKGLREKHPQLRDRSLDDLMSTAEDNPIYSTDPIGISFGGPEAGRSLVKSALALTYDAGVDPSQCDLALEYLRNEGGEACFGYYYGRGNDLVVNRPEKLPLHCVYVVGSSSDSTLLGYIELYGLWRMVLCLSETYTGKDFSHMYAIDPIEGGELDITVNLNLSVAEIREAYQGKHCDQDTYLQAIENVVETVREVGFDREFARVYKNALQAAMIRLGVSEGDIMTDDLARELARDVAEAMMPFIIHNSTPMDVSHLDLSEFQKIPPIGC